MTTKALVAAIAAVVVVFFGVIGSSIYLSSIPPEVDIIEKIETNETAFVVPVEGDTSQPLVIRHCNSI